MGGRRPEPTPLIPFLPQVDGVGLTCSKQEPLIWSGNRIGARGFSG
jgi:hypothetical protein